MSVLSIIYNDESFIFEPLQNNNFASILQKNIKAFAIEMCKVANGMSLRTISEVFQLREKSYHSKHHKSQLTVTVISNLSLFFVFFVIIENLFHTKKIYGKLYHPRLGRKIASQDLTSYPNLPISSRFL